MVDFTTNVSLKSVDYDPFVGPEIVYLVPTTEPQMEIWIACVLGGADASRAYNESVSLRLTGFLDRRAIEQAVQEVGRRHESLRSAFSADGRQMCIFRELPIDFTYQDLSDKSPAEQKQLVSRHVRQDALHLFDLLNGPLFKVSVLKLADQEHQLIVTAHHIICDGWSMGIILQDISKLYSGYAQHSTPTLPEALPFGKYADEQTQFLASREYQQIEKFWQNQYRDVPVLNLPTDFPRPAVRTFKSRRFDYRLNESLVADIKRVGVKAGCSFVTTLMSAFEVFLHRLTGQEDIVLGLPSSGQSATGNYHLVGHCVNLLPLRSFPRPELPFVDYLKQRKAQVFDAYEHQRLTFGSLLKKLNIARDASRVPMVPVVFNVDMGLDDGVRFGGVAHELISNSREYEIFEFSLNASGSKNKLTLECSYNTQLFKESTVERMMTEFEKLLEAIVADPYLSIGGISLTNKQEITQNLDQWNNTRADYPRHTPVHQLIAQTAAKYPTKTALVFGGQEFSYQMLNERSSQVARHLVQKGIQVGDIIGVALDRSAEMLISLLAVLKAGAAYVPLDPEFPHDRITFMLEDSAAKMLITSRKYYGRLNSGVSEVLIENALAESAASPKDEPAVSVTGNNLAYVLYTSGSTGKPKGVLIEHHNLVNLLYSMIAWPGITDQDRLLGVTTISFDIAGLELFLPILTGATLVLADSATAKDGRAVLQAIEEQKISIIQATPATYKMMLAAGWEKKLPLKVLCCGEPMSKDLAEKLTARCASLWNMYGPTETTIYSTGKQILATDPIVTIGRPIQNTQVYILDENQKLVPEGVVGEIYIAGDGVARGYLNRPELNREKFIQNPFGTAQSDLLYRTGDLGKFLPDGEIQCLGRADHQLKIRGYRIEPGEIENALQALPDIKEAVVVAREDRPGDEHLVAYVVPEQRSTTVSSKDQISGWKNELKDSLPSYMVPSYFVVLDALPLTLNGKIDRKQLPPHKAPVVDMANQHTAPRTDIEKLVADIWSEYLGMEKISIFDNFFELGGHSLIAVQIMTRLEKETGQHLPLSTLFEHSTIEKLALVLHMDGKSVTWDSLVPIKPKGTKTPLYIVHGAGLHVLLFNALAINMDDDQPVYGLQAKGLNGIDEPLDTIEEMAAYYISAIMAQNPDGPYALAGYSFGGLIAYEMAKQLMAMGKTVKTLAMFDTYADQTDYYDPFFKKMLSRSSMLLKQFFFTFVLLKEDYKGTVAHKKETLKRMLIALYWKIKYGEEKQHEGFFAYSYKIEEKNSLAALRYKLVPLPIKVELFRAKKRRYYMDDFELMGWPAYALKGVDVHDVAGDHNDLFSPPNDKEFGRILQRVLDASK